MRTPTNTVAEYYTEYSPRDRTELTTCEFAHITGDDWKIILNEDSELVPGKYGWRIVTKDYPYDYNESSDDYDEYYDKYNYYGYGNRWLIKFANGHELLYLPDGRWRRICHEENYHPNDDEFIHGDEYTSTAEHTWELTYDSKLVQAEAAERHAKWLASHPEDTEDDKEEGNGVYYRRGGSDYDEEAAIMRALRGGYGDRFGH